MLHAPAFWNDLQGAVLGKRTSGFLAMTEQAHEIAARATVCLDIVDSSGNRLVLLARAANKPFTLIRG